MGRFRERAMGGVSGPWPAFPCEGGGVPPLFIRMLNAWDEESDRRACLECNLNVFGRIESILPRP
jgi:hypothetical protein